MHVTMSDTSNAAAQTGTSNTTAQEPCLIITENDRYLFASGTWNRSWEKLGSHPDMQDGTHGWHFAVWAPGVRSVHVTGPFNNWDPWACPLPPLDSSGIWQGFVAGLSEGEQYKFVIETNDGTLLYKADPYGFYAEEVPGTASRLYEITGYSWGDDDWLERRRAHPHMT